ncbi:MAG: IclR family transcriptional regulator [Trueperaceae bacterium]|nr:IclR family transcriptional regulator [Trueperaceae bacterium]
MFNDSADTSDGKYVVQILARALRVLWTLASRNDGWTLDELAQHEDVNKASMLRILRTLEADRVVLRDKDVYRLGPRVLELSHGYLRGLELDTVARPFMQTLAARTGQTVSLAVRDEFEVVYIAIEKAHREIGIQGEIGGRHPANATALGKVLLADLDGPELDALLHEHDLTQLTHRTIDTPEALRSHLEVVRERGYAFDDEERGIGIRCVAAPIRRADGRVIAAVSVAGAIFHMTEDVLAGHTELVLQAASEISERFGHRGAQASSRPVEPAGATD